MFPDKLENHDKVEELVNNLSGRLRGTAAYLLSRRLDFLRIDTTTNPANTATAAAAQELVADAEEVAVEGAVPSAMLLTSGKTCALMAWGGSA